MNPELHRTSSPVRPHPRRWRRVVRPLVVLLSLLMGAVALPAVSSAAGEKVDLRVLVVAAGNRSEDVALELMVRTLDGMGVPFDVLDSRRQSLTTESLYLTPTHGRYNGIILTISDLYQPGGGSGFTAEEWQLLHQYERDFGVRESVVSGYPTWDPSLDLDYGMGSVGALPASNGRWVGPSGGTEFFEYVNTANNLAIPAFVFTGIPRGDSSAPVVTPLLVDDADPTKVLVSRLDYSDGRQVLLSTIANAWYFVHSYVLAYEFVNFATKGLFIGARNIYLSVHTDDLFIEDEVWDPINNTVSLSNTYRMTADDVAAAVAKQNQFRAEHPLASSFTIQFPFNGAGAGTGTALLPPETYTPTADAEIRQWTCLLICLSTRTRNFGASAMAAIDRTSSRELSRYIVRFEDQLPMTGSIASATLTLTTTGLGGTRPARACRVTEDWVEGNGTPSNNVTQNVSWRNRVGTIPWATAGVSFDPTNCVTFNLRYSGTTSVNLMPIWQQWNNGAPNYGVVIMATNNQTLGLNIMTRESGAATAPKLTLTFAANPPDPLTAAIVANKSEFGFINHTYASLQMDRVCPDPDNPQPPLCPVTSALTARNEILRNRVIWQALGLPEYSENLRYLLSDSHAGIHDRRSTEEDPTDDIPYPEGRNVNFFQAMADTGVRNVASDSSRPNQNIEAFAPDVPVIITPRYPTAIFVNSSTPAENTDQYNWIFHDRYLAAGQDPCADPAAICTPRTWEQILSAEADLTLIHMLSNSMWPHYMHQINLRNYDGMGNSLQFDWLDAVMDRYEQNLRLPVVSLRAWQIGERTERNLIARNANVRGTLDLATGVVTLVANSAAQPTVTGLSGGSLYGGQYQRTVSVSATPSTWAIDPATGV